MNEKLFVVQGQAVTEYIFILALMAFLSIKTINTFGKFFSRSMGNLAFVVSTHLTVGVCKENCFFYEYMNGQEN